MINADKHKSLPDADLRDFLAKNIEITRPPDRIKKEIQKLEAELEKAQASESVKKLISLKDWSWCDVSDEIEDYSSETYFDFVGTDAERVAVFDQ